METFRKFHDHLKTLDVWLEEIDTTELDRPISIEPDVVREQIYKNEVSPRKILCSANDGSYDWRHVSFEFF